MKVIVKGRHMDLTPALRNHAEGKLSDAIARRFDRPAGRVEIELSDLGPRADKHDKECRVSVFMPKGKTVVISEIGDDMYKAIDLAHDRLLMQVTRERERRRNTKRNRKEAQRERRATARTALTTSTEPWEEEVLEYERSLGM